MEEKKKTEVKIAEDLIEQTVNQIDKIDGPEKLRMLMYFILLLYAKRVMHPLSIISGIEVAKTKILIDNILAAKMLSEV